MILLAHMMRMVPPMVMSLHEAIFLDLTNFAVQEMMTNIMIEKENMTILQESITKVIMKRKVVPFS